MFILTERTPNPDAIKFVPHVELTDGCSIEFTREAFRADGPSLPAALFALHGVARVYIAPAFVTVTRAASGLTWETLRIQVIAALADHLESGAPALREQDHTGPPQLAETQIEAEIRGVLHQYVDPGVARDGGQVLFDRFDSTTGVLWIRMKGACGGCPSSRLTLKAGIETIVRRFVPEVARVEEVVANEVPASPSRLKDWIGRFKGVSGSPRTLFTHDGRELTRDAAQ